MVLEIVYIVKWIRLTDRVISFIGMSAFDCKISAFISSWSLQRLKAIVNLIHLVRLRARNTINFFINVHCSNQWYIYVIRYAIFFSMDIRIFRFYALLNGIYGWPCMILIFVCVLGGGVSLHNLGNCGKFSRNQV